MRSGTKYLHDCLDQFPEVSRQQYERAFNLEELEDEVKNLQSREVSIRELHKRFNSFKEKKEHWWFSQYWLLPPLNDLSQEQQNHKILFDKLSTASEGKCIEKDSIQNLLEAFRQIELVSIILRFVCPVSFGILSPPVEHVLGLRRGKNAVATYRNYLKDIRRIRKHYRFETAADADKALWVLEHRCYGNKKMRDGGSIKKEFEEDKFMLKLRVKNLVEPLQDLTPAQLAVALYKTNNRLAALAGCYALEENVKKWAKRMRVENKTEQQTTHRRQTVTDYLDKLPTEEKSLVLGDLSSKTLQESLQTSRNNVFHADECLSDEKLENLVNAVWKIERRLKQNFKC